MTNSQGPNFNLLQWKMENEDNGPIWHIIKAGVLCVHVVCFKNKQHLYCSMSVRSIVLCV